MVERFIEDLYRRMGLGSRESRMFLVPEDVPNRSEIVSDTAKKLFDEAQSEIKITACELHEDCLHPGLVDSLIEAVRRGVRVHIVHPDHFAEPEQINKLKEAGVVLHQIKTRPEYHGWVIDRKHIVEEHPHLRGQRHITVFTFNLPLGAKIRLKREFEPLGIK